MELGPIVDWLANELQYLVVIKWMNAVLSVTNYTTE